MKDPKNKDAAKTVITGQLERIVYENRENGFVVARVNVRGRLEPVTVVGPLGASSPGEVLVMEGEWISHPVFGEQFRVDAYRAQQPVTPEGIKKYLGSGLIKGIGPVMAERIVERFGTRALEVMDKEIERLAEVEGIGRKRMEMIREAWSEQKGIREVMMFLQGHGVGTGHALRIYKTYGHRTMEIVTADPYRLAAEVAGIGFATADRIAASLGFAKDSPVRVSAGVLHVLTGLADEGHVFYPYGMLVEKSMEILGVERGVVEEAIARQAREKRLVIEDMGQEESPMSGKGVYLAGYYMCETGIAHRIKDLLSTGRLIRDIDTEKALEWVQRKLSMRLAEKQVEAVRCAVTSKMMVITGGPGTGKTTIVKAVLRIVTAIGAVTMLAAPTGRAANKLKEATGHEAKTIHRLLEYSMAKGGFQRNERRPLECDLLVVDEASMIDTVLMYHLLKAVPSHAVLILVGDVNQLPSVGPGNVLNDIISSGLVPVVTLSEIFRQAQTSRIIVNAHLINQGVMPEIGNEDGGGDFFFIEQEDPDRVVEIITELVTRRIPDRFGLDPFDDIQVLTPMHKGTVGAVNMNARLQKALNPQGEGGIIRGEITLARSDKVMQTRNNYEKEVFNGDIGRIARVDHDARRIEAVFDGRVVAYDFSELDELVLAYAISVHKSQGSEYPAVVIPVLTQHYMMLWRNLVYTAVTRGRRLVVMVGSKRALAIGVKNNRTSIRYTRLRQRLVS